MLFGHGPLSPSWAPKGHGVSGRGRSHTGQGPAGLSPPTAGPTGTPVDLCEQAGTGRILLVVFQEQAARLLVEGRLGVGVDQQALDGLWEMGTGSKAGQPRPTSLPYPTLWLFPFPTLLPQIRQSPSSWPHPSLIFALCHPHWPND